MAARTLFCDVHFRQIPPRYLAPVRRNEEVPRNASINDALAIINGVRAAVGYLVKKEGRGVEYQAALAAAASAPPVAGTTGGEAPTGSSGVAAATGSSGTSTGSGSTTTTSSPTTGGGGLHTAQQ